MYPITKLNKSNTNCCVDGCYSHAGKQTGLSFHIFPREGERKVKLTNKYGETEVLDKRTAWVRQIRSGKEISKYMKICSLHFKKEDYFLPDLTEDVTTKRRKLKLNAVPTCKLPTEEVLTRTRRSKKKKIAEPSKKKKTAEPKNNSDGYNPKKTKTFTSSEIEKFLNEAPDEEYLLSKVILIVWISGACTIHELTQLKLENIKDLGTSVLITIPDARTKKNRAFTISGKFYAIFKKYLAVRKSPKHQNRFFLYFTKLMKKPVGIHKIASVPKEIAIYLQLKDPELYTRNCIRRCSAASTVDITSLKRNEGCIATALALADKIADVIENAVPKSSSTANKSAGRMKPNCNFEEVYIKQEPSEEMIDETNEDIRVPVQGDIDGNFKCTDYSRLPNDNNSRLRKEENAGTIYIKQEYVGTEELNKDTNSCNVSRNYDMFNAKSATNNDNIVVKEEMINPESADTELYTTLVENIKKE